MTTTCPQCSMGLSFDTTRLPAEPFTVLCPRCRQTVTVMPPQEQDPVLPPLVQAASGTAALQPIANPETELMKSLTTLLSGMVPNTQQASQKWQRRRILLCLDDAVLRERLRTALPSDKFEVLSSNLVQEATEIQHEFRIEVLVLSPAFDQEHSGGAVMMQYVNRLTPQNRRRTFVVLVSPQLRTMDTYLAFANGVNLTVHPEDAESFQSVLERSIRDFNELYRPLYQATESQAF